MAEPAWQYDTYNKIWEVMAQDYQLEARIESLGVKVCVCDCPLHGKAGGHICFTLASSMPVAAAGGQVFLGNPAAVCADSVYGFEVCSARWWG